MRKSEPTLRIDFIARDYPCCSLCGMPFGSEGMARGLIDAFAVHVKREHLDASHELSITQKTVTKYSLRTTRRM